MLQLVLFLRVRPDPCLVWAWSGSLSPRGLLVSRSCGTPGAAPLGFSSPASLSLNRMSPPGSPPPGVSPWPPPFLYHILPWSPSAALVPGLEEGLAAGGQGPACILASRSLDSALAPELRGPLCPRPRLFLAPSAHLTILGAMSKLGLQPWLPQGEPVAAAR